MAQKASSQEKGFFERIRGGLETRVGKGLLVAVIGGKALFLAGCSTDTEPDPTPSVIVTEKPAESLSCYEYAEELKASYPEPGTAEYEAAVEAHSIPFEQNKSGEYVLEQIGNKFYDIYTGGVDILPTDPETQRDCLDTVDGDYMRLGEILGLRQALQPQFDALYEHTDAIAAGEEAFYESAAFITLDALRQARGWGEMPERDDLEVTVSLDNQGEGFLNGDIKVDGGIGTEDINRDLGAGAHVIDGHWKITGPRGTAS